MKLPTKLKSDNKELTRAVTMRFMLVMGELIMQHKRTGGPCKTVKAFAASISADASNFSQYEDNSRNVTIEMCCELCRVHAINANWLLLGTGEKYYSADMSARLVKMEQRLIDVEVRVGIAAKTKK